MEIGSGVSWLRDFVIHLIRFNLDPKRCKLLDLNKALFTFHLCPKEDLDAYIYPIRTTLHLIFHSGRPIELSKPKTS